MVDGEDLVRSGMSDHSLILWRMCLDLPNQSSKEGRRRKIRKLQKIDKREFIRDMAQQPWEELAQLEDAEEMVV